MLKSRNSLWCAKNSIKQFASNLVEKHSGTYEQPEHVFATLGMLEKKSTNIKYAWRKGMQRQWIIKCWSVFRWESQHDLAAEILSRGSKLKCNGEYVTAALDSLCGSGENEPGGPYFQGAAPIPQLNKKLRLWCKKQGVEACAYQHCGCILCAMTNGQKLSLVYTGTDGGCPVIPAYHYRCTDMPVYR